MDETKHYLRTNTDRPIGPETEVGRALAEYLGENGFDAAEYTSPTFRMKLMGRYHDFPNSADRQWAIPLHDLHHLATGYGTDFIGEAEIGAWELRAGCRTFIVYCLNATAVAIGLVLSPRRVLAAFRAAEGARSLYRRPLQYEAALKMTSGELRAHLGVAPEGIAKEPRRLHSDAQASRSQEGPGQKPRQPSERRGFDRRRTSFT
jgi:hypothetical protein